MGRKIPGKKHRGVKDPEAQKKAREEKVKTKVNALPANVDEQEVPKKWARIMQDKDKWTKINRQREEEKKNRRKGERPPEEHLLDSSKSMTMENRLPGMKRPLKPIPVFRQRPEESKKAFFNRMENTVKSVIERSKYEDKYGVEVSRDEFTGQTKVVDRPKDEVELELERARIKRLAKKGIVVRTKEERRQIRRQKEKEKRMKKKRKLNKQISASDKSEDTEVKEFQPNERVGFNEVAMEPPTLRLGKAKKTPTDKLKAKNSKLLLAKKLTQGVPDKSLAKKKMLEDERQRVIEAYRKMKSSGGGRISKVNH